MSMTLAERLAHARSESGFAETAEAARAAGITASALYQLEDGTTQSLRGTTAVKLGKAYPRFRVEWLIAGSGPQHHQEVKIAEPRGHYGATSSAAQPDYVRLPLLSMEGDMGHGSHNNDPPEVVQFLDIAEWWARQHLPTQLSRVKVISARGDSMSGVINHGDVVFVDTGVDHFDSEGIYVFNWQGRALIKRLAPNLRTGKLQIQSANPAYPAEDINPGEIDQLHIAGRVAAWWTLRHY